MLMIGASIAMLPACKKKEGCTDPAALNYDPSADKDNGSCEYATIERFTVTDLGGGVMQVQGSTNQDFTFTSDKKWLVNGFLNVKAPATLTVQAGTIVKGDKDSKGTVIINRGAKIDAVGTASQPIVFTSNQPVGQRSFGDWGGIIIAGNAPVNLPGGEGVVEGGTGTLFGGTNVNDNSGKLRFVRIEFSGIPFQPNQEINGLTLGGVGRGTEIDHIQVSYCGDDSYEMFGGSVDVKYIVSFRSWDDDFDMDNGYTGKVQFAVALRDPQIADQSGSNGFEHDNDGQGTTSTPLTSPILSNVSVFGPLATPGTPFNDQHKRAMHLRRNTRTKVFNSVFAGHPTGLLIDGSGCEAAATNGELKVKNCVMAGMTSFFAVASGSSWNCEGFYTSNDNTTYGTNTELGVVDAFNLLSPNFTLTGSSPLLTGASFADASLSGDSFFEVVSFRGAFGAQNWTEGWCNWDPQNTPY